MPGIIALLAVVAFVLIAVSKASGSEVAPDSTPQQWPDEVSDATETVTGEPEGGVDLSGITHDQGTWPSGDRIWDICQAIATAEGAYRAGSVPDLLNNPGDLSDGAQTYGSQHHSGSDVTVFPDKTTGWQWLYNKVQRIANGSSSTYSDSLTITEVAKKWAGDWHNWKVNVGDALGVDPDQTTFADYVNGE